jgi:flagellar hook-length control protein FliK
LPSASAVAADGNNELNASSFSLQSTEPELSESDTFFTAQMKKMVFEQQGAMNPDRQLSQQSQPSMNAAAAAADTDTVSASQFRTMNTPPPLTTETASSAVHQVTISETFGKPEWNQGMSKQMLWMANQNIRTAELRLNPAHLGPIEVRIEMEDDQVNLAFSSRSAVVREAVEQAIPRLREMFEDSGLSLADTDVSQQSFAEQRSQESADYRAHHGAGLSESADPVTADISADAGRTGAVNTGLVDYFI